MRHNQALQPTVPLRGTLAELVRWATANPPQEMKAVLRGRRVWGPGKVSVFSGVKYVGIDVTIEPFSACTYVH